MDLDTIIYIIAVAVTFIVSLLGQKKKKKKAPIQSDTEDIEYSLNDFEKILQRKEEFEQVQEIEKDEVTVENSYGFEETKDIKHSVEEDNHIEKKKEDKKKDTQKEEKEDGFDLNSAIIYSSILERKKFRH